MGNTTEGTTHRFGVWQFTAQGPPGVAHCPRRRAFSIEGIEGVASGRRHAGYRCPGLLRQGSLVVGRSGRLSARDTTLPMARGCSTPGGALEGLVGDPLLRRNMFGGGILRWTLRAFPSSTISPHLPVLASMARALSGARAPCDAAEKEEVLFSLPALTRRKPSSVCTAFCNGPILPPSNRHGPKQGGLGSMHPLCRLTGGKQRRHLSSVDGEGWSPSSCQRQSFSNTTRSKSTQGDEHQM